MAAIELRNSIPTAEHLNRSIEIEACADEFGVLQRPLDPAAVTSLIEAGKYRGTDDSQIPNVVTVLFPSQCCLLTDLGMYKVKLVVQDSADKLRYFQANLWVTSSVAMQDQGDMQ